MVSANSTLTTPEGELTEIQRLLKKVQQDGVNVLSLSERVFLTHHTRDEPQEINNDFSNQIQLLQLQVEQERIVVDDLRRALESENKNSLEMISKLTKERKQRSELEDSLADLRKLLAKERSSRGMRSLVDSDNEEFLNTIEEQRKQIGSLEESLEKEKDNFTQLQNVLQEE